MKFSYLLFLILAINILIESRNTRRMKNRKLVSVTKSYAKILKIARVYAYDAIEDLISNKDDEEEFAFQNEFQNEAVRVIFGTIKESNSYIVSFRGTNGGSDWESWMTNIKMTMTETTFCKNDVKVHSGFLHAFNKVKEKVLNKVLNAFTGRNHHKNLIITGHSLGGAMGSIAYAYVNCILISNKNGGNPKFKSLKLPEFSSLITFGAPRTGNLKFARLINQLAYDFNKSLNIRITLGNDLVPQVPSKNDGECAYVHAGTEINFKPIYDEDDSYYSEYVFWIKNYNVDETPNFYNTLFNDMKDLSKSYAEYANGKGIFNSSYNFMNFSATAMFTLQKYGTQVTDHVSYQHIQDSEFLDSITVFNEKYSNLLPCANDESIECTELNTHYNKDYKKSEKTKDE